MGHSAGLPVAQEIAVRRLDEPKLPKPEIPDDTSDCAHIAWRLRPNKHDRRAFKM